MEIEGKQYKDNKGAPDTDYCVLDKYTMKASATADQQWQKIQENLNPISPLAKFLLPPF